MRRYDLGDTVSLRREVRDLDGALVDATVTFTVTPPTPGTPDTPTPVHTSTGIYDVTVEDVDIYGVYSYIWDVTGVVDDVSRGQFYVADDDDTLPPLASLDRLSRKLGYTPTDAEADRASDVLDAASDLIRDIAGKTWVDEDTGALQVVPRRVRQICVEAAFRGFGNPEGLSQRTIGDSSKSFDRAKREGSEAVYLTKEEEKAIRRAGESASSMINVTLVTPYNCDPVFDDEGEVIWA